MNPIKPCKEAMLLCDQVITEAATGKKSLIGVFERICVLKLPCTHPALAVYVKFTGAQGSYQFRLELVDLQSNRVVGASVLPALAVEDRLGSYELVFNLRNTIFQSEGKYEFRIYADDAVFGAKTFSVAVEQVTPVQGGS